MEAEPAEKDAAALFGPSAVPVARPTTAAGGETFVAEDAIARSRAGSARISA
jgi:hypothetical protein